MTKEKKKPKSDIIRANKKKIDKIRDEAVKCGKIEILNQQHLKATVIAKEVGLSPRQVRYRIAKKEKFNSMAPRPKSGRPKCSTEREDRLLLFEHERNPSLSIPQVLQEHPEIHISRSTAYERLQGTVE